MLNLKSHLRPSWYRNKSSDKLRMLLMCLHVWYLDTIWLLYYELINSYRSIFESEKCFIEINSVSISLPSSLWMWLWLCCDASASCLIMMCSACVRGRNKDISDRSWLTGATEPLIFPTQPRFRPWRRLWRKKLHRCRCFSPILWRSLFNCALALSLFLTFLSLSLSFAWSHSLLLLSSLAWRRQRDIVVVVVALATP